MTASHCIAGKSVWHPWWTNWRWERC